VQYESTCKGSLMFGVSTAQSIVKLFPGKALAVLLKRTSSAAEQAIYIMGMKCVLAPAAYIMPRRLALQAANIIALLLLILPVPGFHIYWEMRSAFGKGRIKSIYLTWEWLARPLRDFVVNKRLLYKRENPFNWKIVEKNVDSINSLRESGESYIITVAHFSSVSNFCMFSPAITYGQIVHVVFPPPERIRSLKDLRIRIGGGTLMKAFACCWGRANESIFSKDLRTARKLYSRLHQRGNVVFIPIDAPWPKTMNGAYERPFAGQKKCVFSTGAALLARLAQCPMIICVPLLERDGTVVLEWGEPIRIAGNDATNDVNVMNELFDTLEVAVGERPTQFIFEIGGDRRWNPQSRRWEDFTE
jgi:lauroyl/myristoyl acyltransferase